MGGIVGEKILGYGSSGEARFFFISSSKISMPAFRMISSNPGLDRPGDRGVEAKDSEIDVSSPYVVSRT